jgi:predicted nucleic acid-binding protein
MLGQSAPVFRGRYRRTRVHFVDCIIAAAAAAEDTPVATFDEDFRKFGDVRIENA